MSTEREDAIPFVGIATAFFRIRCGREKLRNGVQRKTNLGIEPAAFHKKNAIHSQAQYRVAGHSHRLPDLFQFRDCAAPEKFLRDIVLPNSNLSQELCDSEHSVALKEMLGRRVLCVNFPEMAKVDIWQR